MSHDDAFRNNLMEGSTRFQSARVSAFWQEMFGLMRGKSTELMSFDDIRMRLRLREENYKGLQDIPLDQVVGSVGRYRDFTRSFLPKKNNMRERWSRVYAQANSMVGLPPIEVYKIGDLYFVRDGNHRVSVARQLDAKTIQAHVTELPTSIRLWPGMTEEELDGATAYAAFLAETGLDYTRINHQPINLTERSRYAELLGHIYTHKETLEHAQNRPFSLEEAAADWYDSIYRPAVTLIRKYSILNLVPGRTEADLYLWIVDHINDMRDQYGDDDSSPRKISQALAEFLRDKDIPVPEELEQERDPTLRLTRADIQRMVEEERLRELMNNPDAEDPNP